MGYRRLAPEDRYQIEGFLKSGMNQRDIARALCVHASTISREVRKSLHCYSAAKAQVVTEKRLAQKAKDRRLIQGNLEKRILARLTLDWSPEQISGRLRLRKQESISHQTIYRHIAREKVSGNPLHKHLRILRRQRRDRSSIKWRPRSSRPMDRLLIDERPSIVGKRQRLGDLERDTVFGSFNRPFLLTIVDRSSRRLRMEWVEKKCSLQVHKATVRALGDVNVHTITNDNGAEFCWHQKTARALNTKIYFSNAYRSWERGTNENLNGLLRQYFPRKKDIGYLTRREIKKIERQLNTRPRKCLGYRTPLEVEASYGQPLR